MTTKTQPRTTRTTKKPSSLSGDHFTLEQVALEAIHYATSEEDIKTVRATLSDHFLSAAQLYIGKPKKNETMEDDHPFLVACKAQEKMSKESKGIDNWDTVPRAWTQLKSNMKQAFNIGLDVSKYKTEASLRVDLNEARKAKKQADKTPEQKAVEQVNESLDNISKEGETIIQQRLFAIIESCKGLSVAQADDVAKVLATTLEDINILKQLVKEEGEQVAA